MSETKLSLYSIVALVYVTLFIDSVLNTMVAPIMPAYFYNQHHKQSNKMTKEVFSATTSTVSTTFATMVVDQPTHPLNHSESAKCEASSSVYSKVLIKDNTKIAFLLGSKPLVQLISNIAVGPITDKIGFGIPLIVGFCILVISSLAFAFGSSYWMLLLARSVQGIGSACGSTAGMAMLAQEFSNVDERGKMMSLALGGLAMGVLSKNSDLLKTATLLKDPYIALCLVILIIAVTPVVVVEAGQPTWMLQTMCAAKWMLGVAFLPESIAYMIGIYFNGWCLTKVKRYIISTIGLSLTGIGTIALPFSKTFGELWAPGLLIGFGMGLNEVSIFPTMGYLIDIRHGPVYGRVYALADSSFCLSFIIGDVITGLSIREIGYKYLLISAGVACLAVAPFALFLRNPPAKSFEDENDRTHLEGESVDYESLKPHP